MKKKLIIPEIVKVEFENGFIDKFEKSKNALNNIKKTLDEIQYPLELINGEYSWGNIDKLRKKINSDLNELEKKFKKINANEQKKPIIKMMEHKNAICKKMNSHIMGQAIIRTLTKRAPSHKNFSQKDCLIVESLIDHFSKESFDKNDKVYFVSYNHLDFSNPNNKNKLHPHLVNDFKAIGLKLIYTRYLARLLKDVFEQKISEDEINYEKKLSTVSLTTAWGVGSIDPTHYSSQPCLANTMAFSEE